MEEALATDKTNPTAAFPYFSILLYCTVLLCNLAQEFILLYSIHILTCTQRTCKNIHHILSCVCACVCVCVRVCVCVCVCVTHWSHGRGWLLPARCLWSPGHQHQVLLLPVGIPRRSPDPVSRVVPGSLAPASARARLGGPHQGQASGPEAHAHSAGVEGGPVVLSDVHQPSCEGNTEQRERRWSRCSAK